MTRVAGLALAAGLTLAGGALACGARLPTGPLAPVEGRFPGGVQGMVAAFNQALDACGEARSAAAQQYNTVRARSDQWDFWTVTLGLVSDAVGGVIAVADSGSRAPRTIVASSGIAVGLSQAIKAATRVEDDANRKYQAYAFWNARVVGARADLARLQPALESADPPPAARAALDSLTAGVIRRCAGSPDPR